MDKDRIETQIINVIDELVRFDPSISRVICDVGANSEAPVADYFILHHSFSAYLFEPQEACISKLHKRFQNQSKVKVIKAALGDQSGTMPLFESADGPGGECATLYDGDDPWQDITVNKSKKKMIRVYKGDELFEKYDIDNIGILKIDTEGFDSNVLKGINLSRFKPSIIVTEEYLWNEDSTFSKYDYLDENNYILLGFLEYNSVWVRKGFAGITSTRVALSGTSWHPEIGSLVSKLHGMDRLLKRSERDESFDLAQIDAIIGVKDVQYQGDLFLTFFIFNKGEVAIPCRAHNAKQIFVSYHLRGPEGEMLSWHNPRLPLKQDVGPKEIYYDTICVQIPEGTKASGLQLDMDLLDEGIGWYSATPNFEPDSIFINLKGERL